MTTLHDRPSPTAYLYLATLAAGVTAATYWMVRREGRRVVDVVRPTVRAARWQGYLDCLADQAYGRTRWPQ